MILTSLVFSTICVEIPQRPPTRNTYEVPHKPKHRNPTSPTSKLCRLYASWLCQRTKWPVQIHNLQGCSIFLSPSPTEQRAGVQFLQVNPHKRTFKKVQEGTRDLWPMEFDGFKVGLGKGMLTIVTIKSQLILLFVVPKWPHIDSLSTTSFPVFVFVFSGFVPL